MNNVILIGPWDRLIRVGLIGLAMIAIPIGIGCKQHMQSVEPKISENFTTTPDGIEIYYRVAGSGDEVVMVPNAVYFGNSLDGLAKGRRIITYDPRGRGKSEAAPLDKISLDHLLVDFEAVREAVNADVVTIIGWSGYGMEMFVYTLRHPEKVSRLVQFAPVAARFDPYGAMMMEDRDQRTDKSAREAFRKRVEADEFENDPYAHCRAFGDVTNPPLFADRTKVSMIPDVCGFENEHPPNLDQYFGKLFESIIGYDWRDDLEKVTIPRLIIHGEMDNIALEGNIEWVRGQSNARLMIVENAGHFPQLEAPHTVLQALDVFLNGEFPETAIAYPNETP